MELEKSITHKYDISCHMVGLSSCKIEKRSRNTFQKKEKRKFGLVKSYWVISLLNCIDKVVEIVIANELIFYGENYFKLHLEQIGSWRKKLAIDVIAILIHTVHKK